MRAMKYRLDASEAMVMAMFYVVVICKSCVEGLVILKTTGAF